MQVQSMLKGLLGNDCQSQCPTQPDIQEEKAEIFEPSLRDRGIIRSEQLYEETGQGARAGGRPGWPATFQAMPRRGKMATTTNAGSPYGIMK